MAFYTSPRSNMDWKKTTKYVTLAAIIGLIIYDVFAIVGGGKEASISWLIISRGNKDYPLLVYAFWFLMGHLFWTMKDPTIPARVEAAMRKHYTQNATEKDDYIKKVVQDIREG
jgi:hypothetical protein